MVRRTDPSKNKLSQLSSVTSLTLPWGCSAPISSPGPSFWAAPQQPPGRNAHRWSSRWGQASMRVGIGPGSFVVQQKIPGSYGESYGVFLCLCCCRTLHQWFCGIPSPRVIFPHRAQKHTDDTWPHSWRTNKKRGCAVNLLTTQPLCCEINDSIP